MQLNVPPDLETLIHKRLSTGAYADAEDVVRHALFAQDEEELESWTEEETLALAVLLEERSREAERGELIDGDQVVRDMEAMKAAWRAERAREQ